MKQSLIAVVVAVMALAGCHKPAVKRTEDKPAASAKIQELECSAPQFGWLPTTPEPDSGPAPNEPEDCFFYKAAWQHFLVATQPRADGQPAFLSFPNITTIFGSKAASKEFVGLKANELGVAVRDVQRPNSLPTHPSKMVSLAEGVRQAGGLFGLVVDGAGNPIFYSIHVNQPYANFIKTNGLTTEEAVEKNPLLEFEPGVAEFKAAWAVVPHGAPVDSSYIHAEVQIPNLSQDAQGVLRIGHGTRPVTLKLIALHVAFVIKDHPEFIWSTFDHVMPDGKSDLAPSAASNDPASAVAADPKISYTIFAKGAARSSANSPCPALGPATCDSDKSHPVFDVANQSFASASGVQQTSVFREFPSSKSDRWAEEDQSVVDLNTSMRSLLASPSGQRDVRANYRLVGATWLENPRDSNGRKGDFVLGRAFANPIGQDTENRSRIVSGEDALSSTAMESFTQRDSPGCFSCHDTKRVLSDEQNNPPILKPTMLNVSHVISRYLSQPQ